MTEYITKYLNGKIKAINQFATNFLQGKSLPDHESSARLYLFFILTIISLCVVMISFSVIIFDVITRGVSIFGGTSLIIISLMIFYPFLLFLAKKGYRYTASYLLSLTFTGLAIYCTFKWGPSLPITLLIVCFAVTTSGILLKGKSAGLVSVILVLSLIYGVSKENSAGALSWRLAPATYPDVIIWAFIILSIAGVAWLSTQHTFAMLKRAKKYELELEEEKKSLEMKVKERTAELRKIQAEQVLSLSSKAEIGKIAEGLFHDLMSPLSSISLIIEQISIQNMQSQLNTNMSNNNTNNHYPRQKETEEIKSFIETATKAGSRMRNFLTTMRKYFNDLPLSTYFDPKEEIKDAILLLSFKARNADVDVTFIEEQIGPASDNKDQILKNKETKVPVIFGNPVHFHRIFLNLISNAIDSCIRKAEKDKTGAQNKVQIIITKEKMPPGVGFGFAKSEVLKIKVMDTGIGIPKERIDQIFSNRWSSKNNEENASHGLGLSIVSELIEHSFKGKILVQSEEYKQYEHVNKTASEQGEKNAQNENTVKPNHGFNTVFSLTIPCSNKENLP